MKKTLLFTIMLIMLMLNINYNAFGIFSKSYNSFKLYDIEYDEVWFEKFQDDSEALVIYKIIDSKRNGVSNYGGMLIKPEVNGVIFEGESLKTVFYKNINKEVDLRGYTSQVGLQGMIMGKTGQNLNISNENLYNLYVTILSLLLAIILTGLIYWVYTEFNIISGLIVFIFCLYSPYLNGFGNNLYWVFFTCLLPFVSLLMILAYFDRRNVKYNNWLIGVVTFITILLKVLNGNEYITTIGISLIVPLVYYAIKNSWKLKDFFIRGLNIAVFAMIAFFTQISIWIIQLKSSYGFEEAIRIVKQTIIKRTGNNAQGLVNIVSEETLKRYEISMTSNLFEVVSKYLKSPVLPFLNIFNLICIFGIFLIILIILLLIIRKKKISVENYMKSIAINIATIFSILAPLSWFILAKAHSYIHIHMNHVVWHIPFALLVPIAITQIIICIYNLINRSITGKTKKN